MRSGGFLLVVVSVGAIILRLSISNPVGKELWPGPDAPEYADTARRLAYLEGYGGIDISGVVFPSRYPIFFPLFLVPTVWIWNGDAMHYCQSMAVLGGLSVLLTGIFVWSLLKRIEAAVLAALLVALSPCHILHSHFVMSDLVMLILYQLLILLAFYHCNNAPASVGVGMAGLVVGALLAIRIASIPLVFAGGAFYVLRLRRQWKLLVLFVAGATVFPLLEALNRLVSFGTILSNGYHYYAPAYWAESGFKLFSFKWIMENEGGARIPNIIYFGRMLVGIDGSLIHAPWALGCLSLLAIILLLVRRPSLANEYLFKVLLLIIGPLGLVLLHLAFYWQRPRMMLSMVFILAVLFVISLDWITRQVAHRLRLQNAGRLMASRGLFIVLGIVSLILPAEAAMHARHFPIPPEGFTEELRKEVQKINSPVLVTNLGVLRSRNLLFPGSAANRTLIISISDSLFHDEHAFRINLEKPLYPRKPNAPLAPAIGRWSSSKEGGSGTLELDQRTLELISNRLGGEEALILLHPDEKAQMVIEAWNANAGWEIANRGHLGPFEYWSARPRY
jgi:4-amino-4-deoxy-L-arabinose transferase-like glycosyltransferase